MASSEGAAEAKRVRVLMLIPSYARTGVEEEVATNLHPTMDYYALQARLGAEIADYGVLDRDRRRLLSVVRRVMGRDAALALYGFLERRKYDSVFSNGENVSIPLALLFSMARGRPAHVLIGHHLSTPKKRHFLRRLHQHMDTIFVYAATQKTYATEHLGIPEYKVLKIPFHADHRFYRPMDVPTDNMVCSAGLEWRDYPTMIEAVRDLDVEVRIAAASPWSKHRNETAARELPPNVQCRRYNYRELRDLYARARVVVVPLYENDFQAGVTTLLEAMAMGKPVVITRTTGQRDVVEDGVNGVYVPPGDPAALREAIVRLLDNPDEAARLGANARKTIEDRMTLDHWANTIANAVLKLASPRKLDAQPKAAEESNWSPRSA